MEKAFLDMGALGIFEKIKSNSIPPPIVYKQTEELKPLSLEHFVLAGILWSFGIVISIIVFAYEAIKK